MRLQKPSLLHTEINPFSRPENADPPQLNLTLRGPLEGLPATPQLDHLGELEGGDSPREPGSWAKRPQAAHPEMGWGCEAADKAGGGCSRESLPSGTWAPGGLLESKKFSPAPQSGGFPRWTKGGVGVDCLPLGQRLKSLREEEGRGEHDWGVPSASRSIPPLRHGSHSTSKNARVMGSLPA